MVDRKRKEPPGPGDGEEGTTITEGGGQSKREEGQAVPPAKKKKRPERPDMVNSSLMENITIKKKVLTVCLFFS